MHQDNTFLRCKAHLSYNISIRSLVSEYSLQNGERSKSKAAIHRVAELNGKGRQAINDLILRRRRRATALHLRRASPDFII